MNAWFSADWTDPLHTGGLGTPEDLATFAHDEGLDAPDPEVLDALEAAVRHTPAAGQGMAGRYTWLRSSPATP